MIEIDNKKMWESLAKQSYDFNYSLFLMIQKALEEQGYKFMFLTKEIVSIESEQANWTKNYAWERGTMTIYNLSKEEHLKIVEFLDCIRHPDEPETDSGEKLPCKGCKISSAGCGLTCKKFYEYYSKIKVINVAEDVELIQEQTVDEHWQDVMERAAIAAMQGVMNFFGSIDYNKKTLARLAVEQADALIEELKKK